MFDEAPVRRALMKDDFRPLIVTDRSIDQGLHGGFNAGEEREIYHFNDVERSRQRCGVEV